MWLALSLKKTATISIMGKDAELPFTDIADGCVGCLLVFDTKDSAAKYVGIGDIVEVDFKK